ncbi:MAG: cysteine desulfurase [Alphaproteobacteria bacterium]|nr:MAG: cysteine desulfurase [Alphaproteobacteria bacterium]
MERTYLDYAATAPLRPEAKAHMMELLDVFGNPSSIHAEGQLARNVLDASRRAVADILGVRAERVVFTSGGTEANNIALRGFKNLSSSKTLLISSVEHDCVRNTGKALGAGELAVDETGVVKLDTLQDELAKGHVGLVSVMHANNENGVIQPVEEIARLCRAAGVVFHTDAVQTVGHIPVDVDELGADMLSFAAHKFGGPKGAGVLVLKNELEMQALITGGAQERNRRAGTENVLAIGGMATALQAAVEHMHAERALAEAMASALEAGVAGMTGVHLAGAEAVKLGHVRQLLIPAMKGDDVVIGMDMRGVAVSQGSACGSGRVKESHVLSAMGLQDMAGHAVRMSWGWDSRLADIDVALEALAGVVGR